MDIDFIKEILMSQEEYWVVARKTETRDGFTYIRGIDDIMLITIPSDIKRGLAYEEITLADIEGLDRRLIAANIFINKDYPPFQKFISFTTIYRGYPLKKNVRKFLEDALILNSDNISDYLELINND